MEYFSYNFELIYQSLLLLVIKWANPFRWSFVYTPPLFLINLDSMGVYFCFERGEDVRQFD
jgi:hypothetical protein